MMEIPFSRLEDIEMLKSSPAGQKA